MPPEAVGTAPKASPESHRIEIKGSAGYPLKDHYRHYVRSGDIVRRIDVRPINEKTAKRVTGYGFKALEWRIPDTDRLLILPKALSELGAKDRDVG